MQLSHTTKNLTDKVSLSIHVDEHSVAWIAGTTTKVVEIVQDLPVFPTAEEIQRQHAHLTLAQVQAALDYYAAHQAEIDADIARRLCEVEAILAKLPAPPTREELRKRRQGVERLA